MASCSSFSIRVGMLWSAILTRSVQAMLRKTWTGCLWTAGFWKSSSSNLMKSGSSSKLELRMNNSFSNFNITRPKKKGMSKSKKWCLKDSSNKWCFNRLSYKCSKCNCNINRCIKSWCNKLTRYKLWNNRILHRIKSHQPLVANQCNNQRSNRFKIQQDQLIKLHLNHKLKLNIKQRKIRRRLWSFHKRNDENKIII